MLGGNIMIIAYETVHHLSSKTTQHILKIEENSGVLLQAFDNCCTGNYDIKGLRVFFFFLYYSHQGTFCFFINIFFFQNVIFLP